MKRNSLLWALAAVVYMGSTLASCSNDELREGGGGDSAKSKYVLAATAGDDAAYLVGAETLDEGNASVVGNGLEVTAGTAWIYYKDKYLYNLQYNQGNAGVTESYVLNSGGQLTKRPGTYNITRFTTYGICGANIVTVSAVDTDTKDANNNLAKGLGFNFLNAADETTTTKTIPGENFLNNGEFVTFAGLVEANGKIYTSVVPMGMSKYGVQYEGGIRVTYPDKVTQQSGGSGSGGYEAGVIPTTQFPDSAYVAIYNDDSFTNPVIARTNKIGFASGRNRSQYYQTIWADDEGNVYVFSPGYGRMHNDPKINVQGTLEAGVMRIKKGATEFDPDYYVNLETLAGGQSFLRCWHITGDYFLLQMYTNGLNARGQGATKLAIYKGAEKSFNYVSGLPEADKISSFGSTPYCENGVAYMPVVTTDGSQPALYKINPATHTATKGLVVTSESVSAVGKLTPQN